MNDAVIGKEVDGYRIQAVLGRGGMGTVYKAEDINLSRDVALKRINPSQSDRESFIHRFRSEAQALARIDSPHIVGVYALRETDIGLLIVMEYVEGGTLKEPLENQGPLVPAQALPILKQILQAFHDAHSAGVIHRDIKPQNIMLTADGMVKVTDFGIAKLRQPDSGETVTQGGQGGTLKYMSPEQISNISAVDARSDLYSIGMTAYEMFAGCLPFKESDTDFDIMRKIVEGEIPPPDEFNPDIPSGLAQWVVGAIQKSQDERYQTAEEMLETLHEADRQVDVTMTQPEWEVDDGSSDVDETQTVVPGDLDRTETVVPGADEEPDSGSADPGGQTVLDPDSPPEPESTPSAAEHAPDSASPDEETSTAEDADGVNWTAIAGGLLAVVLIAGGYIAYGLTGGGAGGAATLSLTTSPSGAAVFVNGDSAGTTPLKGHSVEAGMIQVQVEKDGFSPLDTTVQAAAGGQVAMQDVALPGTASEVDSAAVASAGNGGETEPQETQREEPSSGGGGDASGTSNQNDQSSSPAPADPSGGSGTSETTEEEFPTGTIEVRPTPSGTVIIDGEERSGRTFDVSAGTHEIECRHPEHGSVETTVTISEGQTETRTCYFEQTVSVNTRGEAWGRIWLNRTNTDRNTPGTLSLSPGEHRIEVRRNSLPDFQVEGGLVKTERDGDSQVNEFSGSSYQLQVEPTFTKVEHAVVFDVAGN